MNFGIRGEFKPILRASIKIFLKNKFSVAQCKEGMEDYINKDKNKNKKGVY